MKDYEEEYTREDLYEDLEALRKAGLIAVVGITDDGQWLYGPTELSTEIMKGLDKMDPEDFHSMVDDLVQFREEQEDE